MLIANRGRLQAGHPGIVGGAPHRRSLNPAVFSTLIAPLVLFMLLVLIVVRFAPVVTAGLYSSRMQNYAEIQSEPQFNSNGDIRNTANRPTVGVEALTAFTPEVQHWGDLIFSWAENYDLPPLLVAIVMQIESCGNPKVVSSAGAMGLFQVMPFHFSPGEDMLLPESNAARGLDYLRRSFQLAGGQIDLTLAGYNGGLSQIAKPRSSWPEETRRYVDWGLGIWDDLLSGTSESSTLSAWLGAGGSWLCQGAQIAQAGP